MAKSIISANAFTSPLVLTGSRSDTAIDTSAEIARIAIRRVKKFHVSVIQPLQIGRGFACRPVPTLSTHLRPFPRSNASISPAVEFILDRLNRPSSTPTCLSWAAAMDIPESRSGYRQPSFSIMPPISLTSFAATVAVILEMSQRGLYSTMSAATIG